MFALLRRAFGPQCRNADVCWSSKCKGSRLVARKPTEKIRRPDSQKFLVVRSHLPANTIPGCRCGPRFQTLVSLFPPSPRKRRVHSVKGRKERRAMLSRCGVFERSAIPISLKNGDGATAATAAASSFQVEKRTETKKERKRKRWAGEQ